MKAILVFLPNQVSDADFASITACISNVTGFAVKLHTFDDKDMSAEPIPTLKKSKVQQAAEAIVKTCGDSRDPSFKAKLSAMIIDNGNINNELIELFTNQISYSDTIYLTVNNLDWLPSFFLNFRSFIR